MQNSNKIKSIKIFLCGLAMGAADVVPGVSGGTIAFITGIYEELLNSIKSIDINFMKLFFKGKFKEAFSLIPFSFLIPLFFGIFVSIFSLANLILFLLTNHPLYIWSFFLGLILASVLILYKELPNKTLQSLIIFAIGSLFAYFISTLTPLETPNTKLFTFLSGVIAICAMILPGISGSFLLVILGKYQTILTAVTNLDFTTLGFFALGAVCGLLSFVRLLTFALKHYYNFTIALLLGIMFGSLKRITLSLPKLEMNISLFYAFLCVLIGICVPIALQKLAKSIEVTENR